MKKNIGEVMYSWAEDLFPICRSITGPGVRKTLLYFKELLPDLEIHSVPTGTKAFDWVVPNEWFVQDAYVEDMHGNKIVDFANNNLHLVGYSVSYRAILTLNELQKHLYSLPKQPNAIPYVTSYYEQNWGFCISEKDDINASCFWLFESSLLERIDSCSLDKLFLNDARFSFTRVRCASSISNCLGLKIFSGGGAIS